MILQQNILFVRFSLKIVEDAVPSEYLAEAKERRQELIGDYYAQSFPYFLILVHCIKFVFQLLAVIMFISSCLKVRSSFLEKVYFEVFTWTILLNISLYNCHQQ